MTMRKAVRSGLLIGLALLGLVALPGGAAAHERRDLAGGKYQVAVGFLNEPAIEGAVNGLDLTVMDMSTKDSSGKGTPVEGIEKTLKAEVLVPNGARKDLPIQTRFGMPGKYTAPFIPTAPGTYIFHIFGAINEQKVDEKFESGPGRFNDVEPLATLQFPNQVTIPKDLQSQLDSATSAASTARLFGVAGLVAGLVGLAVGGLALARRPTRSGASAGTDGTRRS